MKPEAYRELKVLEHLCSDTAPTQRHLAKELGVALGLMNLMIRRLIKKGHVKIVNLQRNRIRYLITPQGIAEKTRLTYEYLDYSLYLYRQVRQVLQESLRQVAASGGERVVLFGANEIAEIVYLAVKEAGLDLIGVIDTATAGGTFLGLPVMAPSELPALLFDCGIISALSGGPEERIRELQELGVPEQKIIFLEQHGSDVRAVLPIRGECEMAREGVRG